MAARWAEVVYFPATACCFFLFVLYHTDLPTITIYDRRRCLCDTTTVDYFYSIAICLFKLAFAHWIDRRLQFTDYKANNQISWWVWHFLKVARRRKSEAGLTHSHVLLFFSRSWVSLFTHTHTQTLSARLALCFLALSRRMSLPRLSSPRFETENIH